jgi:hypothetical protein
LQEVAVGRDVILLSGTSSIEFSIVGTVADWFLRWQVSQQDSSRQLFYPNFLTQYTWASLRQGAGWEHLCKFYWTRGYIKEGAGGGLARPIHATSLVLTATDPRDHIYGILGISNLLLLPDYKKDVRDVYCDFMRVLVDVEPSLHLLSLAGTAEFANSLDLPSWCPNFPEAARTKRQKDFMGQADARVFDGSLSRCYVNQRSLHVAGLNVDQIVRVELGLADSAKVRFTPGAIEFFHDFVARYPRYITGNPPLQAIFRVATCRVGAEYSRSLFYEAVAFLRRLLSSAKEAKDEADIHREGGLEELVFSMLAWYITVLGPLGFHFRDGFNMAPLIRELMLPQSDVADFCIPDFVLDGDLTIHEALNSLTLRLGTHAFDERTVFFETANGFLGLGPKGVEVGDHVCILKGYNNPAILRREGAHNVFVSPAFVEGLMEGEAAELVRLGDASIQFEIR